MTFSTVNTDSNLSSEPNPRCDFLTPGHHSDLGLNRTYIFKQEHDIQICSTAAGIFIMQTQGSETLSNILSPADAYHLAFILTREADKQRLEICNYARADKAALAKRDFLSGYLASRPPAADEQNLWQATKSAIRLWLFIASLPAWYKALFQNAQPKEKASNP